ncbi:hypothetical protein PsorP6_000164 [Peronosclerospora sorghi]|uniref:Uncharacterized protein n=1 Tax=Peronosclerospora sorghi TaxID=230839 RepID=A0ACC0WVU8_9STRA|nr:hypothetical protein PsorP6_000164 [Peronosclerospora sorghi]
MQRMTQCKQKAASAKAESSLGLLAYTVLMAADILLYRATHVPVALGTHAHDRDNLQRSVWPNGKEVLLKPFPIVEAASPTHAPNQSLARIMRLRDPTKKMSKSDASALSRIEGRRARLRCRSADGAAGLPFPSEETTLLLLEVPRDVPSPSRQA